MKNAKEASRDYLQDQNLIFVTAHSWVLVLYLPVKGQVSKGRMDKTVDVLSQLSNEMRSRGKKAAVERGCREEVHCYC